MQDIYLYVSVPFCLRRCNYCYCTAGYSDEELLSYRKNSGLYVDSVLKEVSAFRGEEMRCLGISFGGGTPSLLSVSQAERLLNAVMKSCASIKDGAQINMEIFPGTKSRNELKALRSLGFNRASIGAQSFDDKELRLLGRVHNTGDIYKTHDDLMAAGFDNINVDIMFGLPTGNMTRWMKTVDATLALKPTHLTAYYWFITNNSFFFKKIREGMFRLTSREECVRQYRYVIEAARGDGLSLYFDYNFSRGPERQYAIERDIFRLFPIKGFGPGAWSQAGRIKEFNAPSLETYFRNPLEKQQIIHSVDGYMMSVLTYPQGLVFSEFERFFNRRWSAALMGEKMKEAFASWQDKGFIFIDNTCIRFRPETWAQSAILLAELQTRLLFCPEDQLALLALQT